MIPRPVTKVPCRLDFKDPKGATFWDRFKIGRGRAGWTVVDCGTPESAAEFYSAHRHAEMPCWKRFEIIDGALWCTKP